MSILCGVCNSKPPKYKCPTCQLRYCSIVCFKPHKETHSDEPTQSSTSTPVLAAPSVQPPQPSYNIYNLKSNPEFLDILKRHPGLKSQLAEVWQLTLPPSMPIDASSSYHSRGGRQGGRFKQEKADEAAARAMENLRADETANNEGLREFVKLVTSLSTPVVEHNQ